MLSDPTIVKLIIMGLVGTKRCSTSSRYLFGI